MLYICHKLWKLAESRQSYCKESRVQFFWPTLYSMYAKNSVWVTWARPRDRSEYSVHTYEPGCSGKRCEHGSAVTVSEFETESVLHSATWSSHLSVRQCRRNPDNVRRSSENDRRRLETSVHLFPSHPPPTTNQQSCRAAYVACTRILNQSSISLNCRLLSHVQENWIRSFRTLLMIWDNLPEETIHKSGWNFRKRLAAC